MSYRVKTICRLTGINRSTLLAWERRYKVVTPLRADNGYRLYTQEDLERLTRLKSLVDSGHAVSEAMGMLPGPGLDGVAERLRERLGEYDDAGATALADEVDGTDPTDLVATVYMPLLRGLGDAWARGETTVAQEHYASGFVRDRLMRAHRRVRRTDGPLAALLTAPGEKHELGLLGVAVRLSELGWRTDWLGLELPIEQLPAYCMQRVPALVATSLITHRPSAERVRLVKQLRSHVPAGTRLAVGGCGARGLDVAGVDTVVGFADLVTLLERP